MGKYEKAWWVIHKVYMLEECVHVYDRKPSRFPPSWVPNSCLLNMAAKVLPASSYVGTKPLLSRSFGLVLLFVCLAYAHQEEIWVLGS